MSYTKKIAEQICNLISTVSNRFPENKKLSLANTALHTLKQHNSRKLAEFYITQIYLKKNNSSITFTQLVKDRNIEFFLQEDLLSEDGKEIAHRLKLGKDINEITVFVETLKTHWKELNEEERNAVWTYFDVLNLLTERYMKETYANK